MKWLRSQYSDSEESCLSSGRQELHCRRLWHSHSALVKGQEVCILSVVSIWGDFPHNSGLMCFFKKVSFQKVLENNLKFFTLRFWNCYCFTWCTTTTDVMRAEIDYFILKSWRAERFVILFSILKCLLCMLCDRRAR